MNELEKCNQKIVKIAKNIFQNIYIGFEDNNSSNVLNFQIIKYKDNNEKIMINYSAELTKCVKNQLYYEKLIELYKQINAIEWISNVHMDISKSKINFTAFQNKNHNEENI